MNPADKLMAWAQITLSWAFLIFSFAVMLIFEGGYAHFVPEQQKSFDSLVDWLKVTSSLVMFFWFQRMRIGGVPDTTQMVTQVHTAPDGSTTKITSPASTVNGVPNVVPNSAPNTPPAPRVLNR